MMLHEIQQCSHTSTNSDGQGRMIEREEWHRYSQPLRWCQTHGRWRTACTCHRGCPTAWRWHHRLLTQRSCSLGSGTNSSRPLCGQWRWWPAGLSLCPTMHCKNGGNGLEGVPKLSSGFYSSLQVQFTQEQGYTSTCPFWLIRCMCTHLTLSVPQSKYL